MVPFEQIAAEGFRPTCTRRLCYVIGEQNVHCVSGRHTLLFLMVAISGVALSACSSAPPERIAFVSNRYDGMAEVFVMNADGSGQIPLTDNPAHDMAPAWSPDGERIAFVSGVTNNPATDESPAWSPDGTRIAFTSGRDDNAEIYVMNADGSEQARVTNNPALDRSPAWSPDGTRIAFVSDRDGNLEIYAMNADGSGQTNLTHNSGHDISPAWRPQP